MIITWNGDASSLITMFLIDFEGSDKGITFNLKPEYPPVEGGLHWIDATFPDNISEIYVMFYFVEIHVWFSEI